MAGIYKLVLAGFEEHVPLEDRYISTKVVGPSGLYLSEMRDRLPPHDGVRTVAPC